MSYLGVAQLVARYLGVVEAASSSLVTQTNKSRIDRASVLLLVYTYFCHFTSIVPILDVCFAYQVLFRLWRMLHQTSKSRIDRASVLLLVYTYFCHFTNIVSILDVCSAYQVLFRLWRMLHQTYTCFYMAVQLLTITPIVPFGKPSFSTRVITLSFSDSIYFSSR